MTALAANRSTIKMGDAPIPDLIYLPVKASTKIYQGALVVIGATGYAAGATAALGLIAVGRAEALADNSAGADGAIFVTVRQGVHKWANSAAGDAIAQINAGADCYLVDDQTVALTDAASTRSRAGKIIQVDTDGVWAQTLIGVRDIGGTVGGPPAVAVVCIPVDLASVANGQIVSGINPLGTGGRVVKAQFVVTKVVTTGAKLSTLQIRANGTNVTGGAIALTSANCTPLGANVQSTAITGANVFTAAQNVDVQASGTTAFVEGAGVLILTFA